MLGTCLTVIFEKIFGGSKLNKLLKVAYSLSWSFTSDTYWEKTSGWRKAIKCVL